MGWGWMALRVWPSLSKLDGMAEANFVDKTIWTGDNLDILRGRARIAIGSKRIGIWLT